MASKKLSAVLEFGGKISGSFKSAANYTTRRIDRIGDTLGAVSKRQAKLRKEIKRLRTAGESYDHLTRRLEQLDRTAARLNRRQKRLRTINRLASKSWSKLGDVGKRALQGLGVAALAAGAAITKLTLDAASYGDELAKTSRRLGFTVESLEELRFVARRSGVEQQVLEKSVQKVQIALGEAARNAKGPYAEAFRDLGINFRKFGKLKPEEQIEILAGRFSQLTDQTQKTFLANRLWGEEGIKMLQVMEAGADGVAELRQKFHELGGSMGTDGAQASEKFQDALEDVKTAAGGVFRRVAVEVLPVLTEAFGRFSEQIATGQIDVKAIGQRVAEFAQRGIELIPVVIRVTERGLELVDALGGIVPVLSAVGAMFGAMFATKAVVAIKAVITVLGGTTTAILGALAAGYAFGTWLDKTFNLAQNLEGVFTRIGAKLGLNDPAFETTDERGLPPPSQGILASGAPAGNRTTNATINVHAAPGQDAEEIARRAVEEMRRQEQRAEGAAYSRQE